eukprot:1407465-Prymnesium_polylepis.1
MASAGGEALQPAPLSRPRLRAVGNPDLSWGNVRFHCAFVWYYRGGARIRVWPLSPSAGSAVEPRRTVAGPVVLPQRPSSPPLLSDDPAGRSGTGYSVRRFPLPAVRLGGRGRAAGVAYVLGTRTGARCTVRTVNLGGCRRTCSQHPRARAARGARASPYQQRVFAM